MQVLQFKDVPVAENGFKYVLYLLEKIIVQIPLNPLRAQPTAKIFLSKHFDEERAELYSIIILEY
jgi:hypothetical protein